MERGDDDSSGQPAPAVAPAPGVRELALAREPSWWRRWLALLGPGLIAGASDDDPATIGTCASIGASVGFRLLWTMLLTYPLMAAVQFISAKIGLVTGRGLSGVLRQHYPRALLYPVVVALVIANTINAGTDLGAVAAGINLLVPAVPIPALIVPVAAVLLALQVWGSYRLIERIFKWLTLALLAYIAAGLVAKPPLLPVLWHTFVPTLYPLDRNTLTALVAISGTTFSPYLYFWQASQEVEEKVAMGRKKLWQRRGTTDTELKYAAWDVNIGMLISNVVTYFIILATGAALYPDSANIQSAQDAAKALQPIAGPAAGILLALGLIGSGCLAVPVLTTSAAYALSEAFGWKYGLNQNPGRAPQFYAVIVVATLVAMEINFLGINPIQALLWTSVIYGFLAPPLLVVLMLVANNRAIMGARVNGWGVNVLGWLSVAATTAAVVGLVWMWLT